MVNSWEQKKIGNILTLQRGYDITKKEQSHGIYPVVSSSGINSYHNEYKVTGPGVVIGRKGTVGSAFYIENDYWPHDTSLYIKDFKGNHPKFLYYLLSLLHLEKLDTGSANPTLNRNFVHLIEVSIPNYKEQKLIADQISLVDEKISINKKFINELEKLSQQLYEYWFIQFDFPNDNNEPYRISGGEMVASKRLNRQIPKGWEVKGLLDIADWISGAQPSKSTFKYEKLEGYIRFVQNRDYAGYSHKTYIPIASQNKTCGEFDIMIDKYGDAGKVRFGISGAYNVALSKISTDLVNGQEYLRQYFSSKWIHNYLKNSCIASTRASLSKENLQSLSIAIPPKKILEEFEKINKVYINDVLKKKEENQKLAELKNWLLPMLMNGQVRVGEVEEKMNA